MPRRWCGRCCTLPQQAGVGPMASVAGAIAQAVGLSLKPSDAVDHHRKRRRLLPGPARGHQGRDLCRSRFPLHRQNRPALHGGSLSARDLHLVGNHRPFAELRQGRCGNRRLPDAALADAAATALGNLVHTPRDINKALELAPTIPLIEGALIIVQDKIGIWGNLELLPL